LNWSDNLLITRNSELFSKTREAKRLFIAPESASWLILEGKELEAFLRIDRPMVISRFLQENFSHSANVGRIFLEKLYLNDLIRISGKSYYNSEYLWKLPEKYPGFLCLHITEACNMECKYCYAVAHSKKARMPVETAKKVIEKILREIPVNNPMIDFHGGEPMLEFDAMVEAAEYGYQIGREVEKKIKFITQTNATLITKEKAEILKKLKIVPGVSLDGPPDIHNRYRVFPEGKKSFVQTWKGLEYLRAAGLNSGVLAVVHHPQDYQDVLKFFLDKGFTSMRINFSSSIGRAQDEMEFHHQRGEDFAKYFLKMTDDALAWCRLNQKPLNIQDLDQLINNLTSKSRPFMCYRSPCGIGNSILGFGIEGGVYGCEEMASSNLYCLGNVNEQINLKDLVDNNEMLKFLSTRRTENIPRCRTCHLRKFHGIGCTSKVYAQFGDIFRESPMCRFYQVVLEELMWKLSENPEMTKFLNFGCMDNRGQVPPAGQ